MKHAHVILLESSIGLLFQTFSSLYPKVAAAECARVCMCMRAFHPALGCPPVSLLTRSFCSTAFINSASRHTQRVEAGSSNFQQLWEQ